MDNKEEWLQQKKERIEELSVNFSFSKYNLLKISYLERLLDESVHFSPACSECSKNLEVLDKLVDEIPYLDLIEHREPYERQFNAIRKHFHQTHGFIAPYHFTALWTLAGIMLIALPALAWCFFQQGNPISDISLAATAFGLIAGYLLGARKDARYRRAKKIL